MFGVLFTNGQLDGSNYDMWSWKIGFLLNGNDVFELLTTTMCVPTTKDKDNKDITSTNEYRPCLVAYQEWCKKDRKVRHTMLYCMHDNLIDEFEIYLVAKEMWDNTHLRYG